MDKCYMTVQWHITEKCLGNCKHCYMEEREKELSKDELKKILMNLEQFENNQNFQIDNFAITGGDPLLAENFEFILSELKNKDKNVSVMGTPDTINLTTINLLKKYGVKNFQMSLDGLENIHDYIRGNGSYKKTIECSKLMQENGIKVNIMFTVTGENYKDLIPLMNEVAKNEIDSFSFDFLCSIGEGKNLIRIGAEETKKILNDYLAEKEKMISENKKTFFHEKSSLLRTIREEKGEFSSFSSESSQMVSGCYIGFTSFAISSDGSFMPCRRLGKKLGNLLEKNLEDIFLGDSLLKKYRRPEFFKSCGSCKMFKFCRGCPAIAIGESEDEFSKISNCFNKDKVSEQEELKIFSNKNINSDKNVERELISRHMTNIFINKFEKVLMKNEIQDLLFLLIFNEKEKNDFFKNQNSFLKELNLKLTDEEIELCQYYMELYREGKVPNILSLILGEKKW